MMWCSVVFAGISPVLTGVGEVRAAIQCYQCHGTAATSDYRPEDSAFRTISTGGFKGNHRTHMASSATADSCTICHGTSGYQASHRDGTIAIASNINASPAVGTYSRGTSFAQSASAVPGTCSNVNCHFETVTPVWGSPPLASTADCGTCHGSAPATGSHPVGGSRHGAYYGTGTSSCGKCHPDHGAKEGAARFAHATSAGRDLQVSFAAAPNNGSGSYSGPVNDYLPSQSTVFGTCSGTYCHSPGTKSSAFDAPNQAAAWGGNLACNGCHKSDRSSGSAMASGSHRAHVDGFGLGYTTVRCVRCHAATVTPAMAIGTYGNHVNKLVNVAFDSTTTAVNGTYGGVPSPMAKAPGSAYGSCTNVYCHSSGQGNSGTWPPTYTTPTWGSAATGQCGTCHGINGATHSGYGTPTIMNSGSHSRHLAYTFGIASSETRCAACHATTLTGFNPTACSSAVCHNRISQKHANYEVNVGFPDYYGATAAYGGTPKPGDGYGSCTNIYCHSDGRDTPHYAQTPLAWGGASLGCTGCHGSATAPQDGSGGTTLSGKHAAHVNNAAIFGTNNSLGCVKCHNRTVSGNSTLHGTTGTQYHVNKTRDYYGTMAGSYNSGTKVCSNVYCHSSGQATPVYRAVAAWTSATGYGCNGCHGADSAFAAAAGEPNYANGGAGTATANSHQRHVASLGITATTGCAACHCRTVDAAVANKLRNYSTLHLNQARNVAMKAINGKSGTYDSTAKTCSATYCHGTSPSPAWGGSTACNSCHSARATDAHWAANSAHKIHWEGANLPSSYAMAPGNGTGDAATYRFACSSCHSPAGGSAHAGGALAASQAAQVYFGYSAAGVRGSYSGTGTVYSNDNGFNWTAGSSGCTATYCHSGGAGQAGRSAVAWSTANKSSYSCNLCHGNAAAPANDWRRGAPLYASGSITYRGQAKGNAHGVHITAKTSLPAVSMQCANCHAATTASSTSISDKRKHLNKSYDVSPGGTFRDGDNTANSTVVTVAYSYNAAGSRCSNVSCHPVGLDVTTTPSTPLERATSTVTWNTSYKCTDCHNIPMQDTDTYHHAMYDYGRTYPTTIPDGSATGGTNYTSRTCTMCHVDHTIFSPDLNTNSAGRSYNLRTAIGSTPTTTAHFTNSDYSASGGGICISCHATERTKSTVRRKQETNATRTPPVTLANYSGSAHQYNVPASFFSDGSRFQGNCSKCHNALVNETSVFMSYTGSGDSFGNHNSGIRRLQGSLGATGGEVAEEQICYRCHSLSGDADPGGGPPKAVADKDYYGVASMSLASQDIFAANRDFRAANPTYSLTSKLYFKPAAAETPAEAMPNQHNTGDSFSGGTWIGRAMSPWETTVAYETKDQGTTLEGTSYWRMVTFTSPAVYSTTTVPAGTWIINLYCRESSTAQNARIRYMVYKWNNPADTMGATIIARGTYATELSTARAPGTVRQIPVNVGALTLNAGEKIVVDLSLETTTTSTNGYTASFYFGSHAPSELTLPGSVAWSYADPGAPGYGHATQHYSGIHLPSRQNETLAYIARNRHIECVDCHNPHATRNGLHGDYGIATGGSSTTLVNSDKNWVPNQWVDAYINIISGSGAGQTVTISGNTATTITVSGWTAPASGSVYRIITNNNAVSRSQRGVSGASVSYSGSWTNGTYTMVSEAAYEYQICFKCHAATDPATNTLRYWNVTSPSLGAARWTNIGLEFNPNNASYHPVIQPLPSTGNRRLTTAALTGGWQPGEVMTCSDCHGRDTSTSATAQGPHGSTVKWLLTGMYQNWPFTSAAANGTSSGGTLLAGTGTATPPANNFCFNCHTWAAGGYGHTKSLGGHSRPCVNCHIRVPHGGKVPRLLTGGNAPSRYKPDGNGGAFSGSYLTSAVLPASGYMGANNVSCSSICGGKHTDNSTKAYSW